MIVRRTTRRSFLMTVPLIGSFGAACATSLPHHVAAPSVPETTLRLPGTLRVRAAGRILSVPLEDYVLATALSEVSPVNETPETVARIFALQSVIARTYAVSQLGKHRAEGFDLCDATHCQLYQPARITSSRFAPDARRAAMATRGLVLAFAARPTQALFHADCGGRTAAAEIVWGGQPVPYLSGTIDDVPKAAHRTWRFSASAEQIRQAVNRYADSDVGRRLSGLRVIERDTSGRAATVEVRGETTKVLRGERLRSVLNATFGARAIMSARFDISPAAGEYRFDGTGFGHGVGLCQVGAAARARRGEPLDTILATYFPGARLVTTLTQA